MPSADQPVKSDFKNSTFARLSWDRITDNSFLQISLRVQLSKSISSLLCNTAKCLFISQHFLYLCNWATTSPSGNKLAYKAGWGWVWVHFETI